MKPFSKFFITPMGLEYSHSSRKPIKFHRKKRSVCVVGWLFGWLVVSTITRVRSLRFPKFFRQCSLISSTKNWKGFGVRTSITSGTCHTNLPQKLTFFRITLHKYNTINKFSYNHHLGSSTQVLTCKWGLCVNEIIISKKNAKKMGSLGVEPAIHNTHESFSVH